MVAFLFDEALPKQVKQPDANNSFGFDEDFVVGGIGVNLQRKYWVVVNVEEACMDDDFLLSVSTDVPSPDFQGCCAW